MDAWTQPQRTTMGSIDIAGVSRAGIGTSIVLPQYGVVFDLAQGLPFAVNQKHFFVSHSHMDHAGGLPYTLSQRGLFSLPPANIYLPNYMVEPMEKILEQWSLMEGHTYSFNLRGVEVGSRIDIHPKHFVQPFPTVHRVPSQGYTLFERHKHLRADLKNKTQDEIVELRRTGVEVNEEHELPLVSFTGDTQIDFIDVAPDWVKNSKILFMEVTYYGTAKTVKEARDWGHIHWDEVEPRLSELKNEFLVLIHLSSRHGTEQFRQHVKKRVSPGQFERIRFFPEY